MLEEFLSELASIPGRGFDGHSSDLDGTPVDSIHGHCIARDRAPRESGTRNPLETMIGHEIMDEIDDLADLRKWAGKKVEETGPEKGGQPSETRKRSRPSAAVHAFREPAEPGKASIQRPTNPVDSLRFAGDLRLINMTQRFLHYTLIAAGLLAATSLIAGGSKPKATPKADAPNREAIVAYNAGTGLLMELEYAKAESKLREAVEADEKFAEAHNNLAFVLRKQGPDHYEEALTHYNRAIKLDKELAEAYMYRGVLHVSMGENKKAQKDLKRLEKLSETLAAELAAVIANGKEKEPPQFFGVAEPMETT